MQLDKTSIAIRERSFPDIMDLALLVIRRHGPAWALASAAGAVPIVLFNNWWLGGLLLDTDVQYGVPAGYLWWNIVWIVWEMPLAAAPATLYLGQALFQEQPSARRVVKDLWKSLPQLIFFQVLLRGLLVLWVIPWFWLFAVRPYLTEIILLERNPWRKKWPGGTSTSSRSSAMHLRSTAELFGRWLGSLALGGFLILAIWGSIWFLRGMLVNRWDFVEAMYTTWLQVAIWTVISYFTVVRFLSYLDLRIRTEGWEIELLMRAEAGRLVTRPWT